MSKNSGVAISLMVPSQTASALALEGVDGALPPSELHITLAYLGDADNVDIDKGALTNVVAEYAKTVNAIRLSINGAGYFENDNTAVWLAVDSAELPELRQGLVQALEEAGFRVSSEHGFTPHITLAYIGNEDPYPSFELLKLNFLVSDLTIMYRDDHVVLPMQKEGGVQLRKAVQRFLDKDKERSLSMENVWEQLWIKIYDEGYGVWPIDIYLDNNRTFVIGARQGRLVRANLDINGDVVTVGDWEDVEVTFVPRTRQQIIKRDGKPSVVIQVVSTSTLNRDAEIDSRALFDQFIARCHETGKWPLVDFFHLNGIVIGRVIEGGAFRDGDCYINVWEFNDDEIGRAAQRGYMNDPDYWGASIEFQPLKRSLVEIGDGVRVPVYEDGIHTYTTIVPESRAAAWFTGQKVRTAMDEKIFTNLVKLLDGNEDLAKQAAEMVDGTNSEIRSSQMVTRSADEAGGETAVGETAGDEAGERVIELDDDVASYLVESVTQSAVFQEIQQAINGLAAIVERINGTLEDTDATLTDVRQRLGVVEVSAEDRVKNELANLPNGTVRVRVARSQNKEEMTQDSNNLNAADAAHSVVDGWSFRNK